METTPVTTTTTTDDAHTSKRARTDDEGSGVFKISSKMAKTTEEFNTIDVKDGVGVPVRGIFKDGCGNKKYRVAWKKGRSKAVDDEELSQIGVTKEMVDRMLRSPGKYVSFSSTRLLCKLLVDQFGAELPQHILKEVEENDFSIKELAAVLRPVRTVRITRPRTGGDKETLLKWMLRPDNSGIFIVDFHGRCTVWNTTDREIWIEDEHGALARILTADENVLTHNGIEKLDSAHRLVLAKVKQTKNIPEEKRSQTESTENLNPSVEKQEVQEKEEEEEIPSTD